MSLTSGTPEHETELNSPNVPVFVCVESSAGREVSLLVAVTHQLGVVEYVFDSGEGDTVWATCREGVGMAGVDADLVF
jgi:hypothetical protein